MKKRFLTSLATTLIALHTPVFSQSFTASLTPFSADAGFSLADGVTDFRYNVIRDTMGNGGSAATHVILEGLAPVGDGSDVAFSPYMAINLDTAEQQDVGAVYLKVPAGTFDVPDGAVASPIVGFVSRNGAFSGSDVTASYGPASGQSSYSESSLDFSMMMGSTSLSGSADYTVAGGIMTVAPFTLSDGANSIDFKGATLVVNDLTFSGVLEAASPSAVAYNDLFYDLDLTFPDVDGDGTPDIIDDSPGGWWGGVLIDEALSLYDVPNLGQVIVYNGTDIRQSLEHGFLYVIGSPSTAFFYDYQLGDWWYFSSSNYNVAINQRWMYSYNLDKWLFLFPGTSSQAVNGAGRWFYDPAGVQWLVETAEGTLFPQPLGE